MATTYTLNACEELIELYRKHGGHAVTLEDGCLGLGLVMCFGDGLKTTIIKEKYVNEWTSVHTIRSYNDMPKKYEQLLLSIGFVA